MSPYEKKVSIKLSYKINDNTNKIRYIMYNKYQLRDLSANENFYFNINKVFN